MSDVEEIKQIAQSLKREPGRLYLIRKISDISGLFLLDKQIAFAQVASGGGVATCTSFLEFQPALEIKSVSNDPTFSAGKYDFLILKNSESADLVDSFVSLTSLYGENPKMPFGDFIYSIIELFQLPKKQTELDCIGLFGELSFIKAAWDYGVDLSFFWHLNGIFSKYDFSSKTTNIEVKTSASGSTDFLIKHEQLFNGDRNIVVVVGLRKEEAMGLSLGDLISYFNTNEPFCSNVAFQLSLQKELTKKIGKEPFENRYEISDIRGFKTEWMDTLTHIPECISEVVYRYTFDLKKGMPLSVIITFI